jgi:hypothetical protein
MRDIPRNQENERGVSIRLPQAWHIAASQKAMRGAQNRR